MKLNGMETLQGEIFGIAGAIALVVTMIYILYYTATYRIARRAIVRTVL